MAKTLVSVVIPTAGRPRFLPRAVLSALECAANGNVEVIVVPNGPDSSWRDSLTAFASDPRVRCEPISIAHANTARNHGLALSKGKYVRFLDDDDYLLPAARLQVEELENSHAEVCSGRLLNIDQDGAQLGIVGFPDTSDFVCAAVSVSGFRLPAGNVYLRERIKQHNWDESVNRAQDYVWMIQLARCRDWHWAHVAEPVGVWFQHNLQRTTTVRLSNDRPVKSIEALLSLSGALADSGRATDERSEAISSALWHFVHWRFPFQPVFWHRVARHAQRIAPNVTPPHSIFELWPIRSLDPVLVEWGMFPLRRITTAYRDYKCDLTGWDYRRRL